MSHTFQTLESRSYRAADLIPLITGSELQIGAWNENGASRISIPLALKNAGTSPAATGNAPEGGQATVGFAMYLSTDRLFGNADDVLNGSVRFAGPFEPGQTYPFSYDSSVTQLPLGSYYLIVRADPPNNYIESNESNNVVISATPLVQVVALSTEKTVIGTDGPDRIWVREEWPQDHSRLLVYVNGQYTVYEPPAVHSPEGIAAYLPLVIEASSGNDRIVIDPGVTSPIVAIGGGGNDKINGGTSRSTLSGGAGNDLIHGTPLDDLIEGGVGNDRMFGYAGNDTILAFGGNDLLDGGAGRDFLSGMNGNDTLLSRDGEADTLTGGLMGLDQAQVDDLEAEVAGIEQFLP